MSSSVYAHIKRNPLFADLVARRTRFATVLSLVVVVLYYGFVLTVAFNPGLIGARVAEGSVLTIGVAVGVCMFVFFWLLTALYVRRANTEFDALNAQIVHQAMREAK